jgi:putative glycosyltransferase (TIGR04348 family)
MGKPHIIIISPALANANNGNWQTAWRWSRFLRKDYRVTLAVQWDGTCCDAMIALHARRSAPSIAAFSAACPSLPLIVVLTGTDLYKDIFTDVDAQRSLQLATHLVVLQKAGLQGLNKDLRSKAQVIYQSAPTLKPLHKNPAKSSRYFDVTMIGHLRAEKDPATFMHAAKFLQSKNVRLIHIGGALDPALGKLAEKTQQRYPHYRSLGNLAHAATRQRLKRSQLMAITSAMEGGANVIIEAVTSGVPVLASDIPGNRGMLGENYAGYFPLGDSLKLAQLIDRTVNDIKFYSRLHTQCAARAPLFSPQRERAALLKLVDNCISQMEKHT